VDRIVSRLRELAESGRGPIITAEAPVFDGGDLDAFAEAIDEVAHWADAINATDNTAAHAHASNVAVAIAILRSGAEPIMQRVCRDKNRLALEADIVGAALHGVENICCLTGDDVTAGDEPEARRVFDLDAPQLISVASTLASGRYLSGRALEPPPSLFVGAVENPGAPPFDYRPSRARTKIEAGARFLQLQICYHADRLEGFVAALRAEGVTDTVTLLPTVLLVRSARSLEFVNGNVPGISVPTETIDRVRGAQDQAEAAYELALEQARFALSLPGVRGLHLADFRRDGALGRLCADLGLAPRSERETHADRSPVIV
jgi:methylenetetrahydrofolate reductase (NADPH)